MAEVTKITKIVQDSNVQIDVLSQDLSSIQQDFEASMEKYEQTLTRLRENVQQLIVQHESEYFTESTTRYNKGARSDTPDYIVNRTLSLNPETEKRLCNRLTTYANWQYPGMIIRPAHGLGLENLVAFDPLYLVDTHEDLFSPVRTMFTAEYQRRLRYYVIEEYTDRAIFWNLPQTQFGLVYAFRYFEFKPWEILRQYLSEVFDLLRPGGSFLFSFNDCDQWRSVGSVENFFCCYTPGRLVKAHAQDLGYEIVDIYNDNANTSWMEVRRPGVLGSIRGGQSLAGIFRKSEIIKQPSTPKIIDKPVQDLYNELDLDRLINLANILNVDISEDKTKREFNIKKVRKRISAYLELVNYPEDTLRQLFKPKETK
jgi:SAM-dependent methyltransferase